MQTSVCSGKLWAAKESNLALRSYDRNKVSDMPLRVIENLLLQVWVRMESNHVPLSYQESVLPVNYAPGNHSNLPQNGLNYNLISLY